MTLLEVRGLEKEFPLQSGSRSLRAVAGVDLDLKRGETLGLVGETGCGKTTLARLILRLAKPTGGSIRFDGEDITDLSGGRLRALRRKMQLVFQDPRASANPRRRIGQIIAEPLVVNEIGERSEVDDEVQKLMARVGLNPEHFGRYPHEFSGGQLQRVGIARALALRPELIVCDEPVSALDVSIRAQVLNLLKDLQEEFDLTYLFISHDLSVVRHIANRVAVMYLGRVVEIAPNRELYSNPSHPYTNALISAVPMPDPDRAAEKQPVVLKSGSSSPISPPPGCPFHPRCPRAQALCETKAPPLESRGADHLAACHFPVEHSPAAEPQTAFQSDSPSD